MNWKGFLKKLHKCCVFTDLCGTFRISSFNGLTITTSYAARTDLGFQLINNLVRFNQMSLSFLYYNEPGAGNTQEP